MSLYVPPKLELPVLRRGCAGSPNTTSTGETQVENSSGVAVWPALSAGFTAVKLGQQEDCWRPISTQQNPWQCTYHIRTAEPMAVHIWPVLTQPRLSKALWWFEYKVGSAAARRRVGGLFTSLLTDKTGMYTWLGHPRVVGHS